MIVIIRMINGDSFEFSDISIDNIMDCIYETSRKKSEWLVINKEKNQKVALKINNIVGVTEKRKYIK